MAQSAARNWKQTTANLAKGRSPESPDVVVGRVQRLQKWTKMIYKYMQTKTVLKMDDTGKKFEVGPTA